MQYLFQQKKQTLKMRILNPILCDIYFCIIKFRLVIHKFRTNVFKCFKHFLVDLLSEKIQTVHKVKLHYNLK